MAIIEMAIIMYDISEGVGDNKITGMGMKTLV